MRIHFLDIFWPININATTINGQIFFNWLIIVALYLLVACVFLAGIYTLRKRSELRVAIKRSIVLSFCSAGLTYAMLSEIIWDQWLKVDISLFRGDCNQNKPYAIEGDMFKFVQECRKIVGADDYTLYENIHSTDMFEWYFKEKLEYYLLPARKKLKSNYIIVFYDNTTLLDQKTGVLYRNNVPVLRVKPIYVYSSDVYIVGVNK